MPIYREALQYPDKYFFFGGGGGDLAHCTPQFYIWNITIHMRSKGRFRAFIKDYFYTAITFGTITHRCF